MCAVHQRFVREGVLVGGLVLWAVALAACGSRDPGPTKRLTSGPGEAGSDATYVQRTVIVDTSQASSQGISLGRLHCSTDSCDLIVQTTVEPALPGASGAEDGALRWCLFDQCSSIPVDASGYAENIANRGLVAYGDHSLEVFLRVKEPGGVPRLVVTWDVWMEPTSGGGGLGWGSDSWSFEPEADPCDAGVDGYHRDQWGYCVEGYGSSQADPWGQQNQTCQPGYIFNQWAGCVPDPNYSGPSFWNELDSLFRCVPPGEACEAERACSTITCWCGYAGQEAPAGQLEDCVYGICPTRDSCVDLCAEVAYLPMSHAVVDCGP